MRRLIWRLWHTLRSSAGEREVAREIASHLALLEDDFQRRGLSANDARTAARRVLGGELHVKDLHRDARTFAWLDDLRWDLAYAARLLRRNPLFTFTAALSVAIGIGANTTVFTITNALLFARPSGVIDPDRVVEIGGTIAGRGPFGQVSYPNYLDVRDRATTLSGVYAYQPVAQPMNLGAADGADRVSAGYVTTNYFQVLGVKPAAGRLFDSRDSDRPGASLIAVLSYGLWTRRFGRDPAVAGRAVTINGQPITVVGVAPDGFHGTSILLTDVWLPIGLGPAAQLASRDMPWPIVGGRLKPGVARAQAAAEIDAMGRTLEREYPVENRGRGLRLVAATPIPGNILPVGAFLVLLTAIVSLVLVLACANVAGVLLARAAARRREVAVRLAIGAGRGRLVRQLLTETTMLFALGGGAGLLLARALTRLLVSLLPTLPLPIDVSLPLDGRVVGFTMALSFGAALLSGLAPALQASRADVVSALKDEEQGPSARLWMRHAFVVTQIAAAILLVVSGGLFIRGLQKAGAVDLGFDPRGIEVTSFDLTFGGYTTASGRVFLRDLAERVRRLPGVELSVLASTGAPVGDGRRSALVAALSAPVGETARSFDTDWNAIDPGYFSTLRIPIVAGRDFEATDVDGSQRVAILGEAAAARFFPAVPAASVLGHVVVLQPGQAADRGGRVDRRRGDAEWPLVVVGIVRDVKYFGPRDAAPSPFVYIPLQQQPFGSRVTIGTRASGDRRLAGEVRALIESMNPNLSIAASQTLEDRNASALVPQRIAAFVSAAAGAIGLLLAAIGIYGVTAYTVARRTREIGVRIALGAAPRDIVGMVLGQGLGLVAVGSAIGLILAVAAGRLLKSFLFGLTPIDPPTFAGASLIFAAVGLAACYVPARRATRIDAMEALRYE